ncbi:MAG: hypothetical protein OHK0035_25090 [Cyanobacteria bacterium J069]
MRAALTRSRESDGGNAFTGAELVDRDVVSGEGDVAIVKKSVAKKGYEVEPGNGSADSWQIHLCPI